MVPRLVTDRLRLREWQEGDLSPFAAMNADRRVMRLLQGPMTLEASAASLGRIRQQWDSQEWGLFAVERRDTAKFIGFCGLAGDFRRLLLTQGGDRVAAGVGAVGTGVRDGGSERRTGLGLQ